MSSYLEGKTVLVCGAAGLIGSAISKAILNHGGRVIASDICHNQLQKKFEQLYSGNSPDELTFRELDITNEMQVRDFFRSLKHIDGAINATYPRNKNYGAHFLDVSLDSFNDNVSLHLGSSFLFIQQCAAYFKSHNTPLSVINISSIYGVVPPNFEIYRHTSMTMPVEYAAIKSALLHLSKYAVKYMKNSGFRVNSISPGGIMDAQPKAFTESYKSCTLGSGLLHPEDMESAVTFLLSDGAKYVNGQNIVVDDGFTL